MKDMNNINNSQLNYSEYIGNKISEELGRRGLTQKDLAIIMQKSEAEVSRWLNGTSNLTLATISKISCALGVDILTGNSKNKPYEVINEMSFKAAESGANDYRDMNTLKLELIGEILKLDNLDKVNKVISFMHTLKNI